MKAFHIFAVLFCSATAMAQKAPVVDPVTSVVSANLLCGQINGKYIVFSAKKNKVWYAFSDKALQKKMKAVKVSRDLDGLSAYEYSLKDNHFRFPTEEKAGGTVLATYHTELGSNGTLLQVRMSASGAYRLFQGENGTNGICRFLK